MGPMILQGDSIFFNGVARTVSRANFSVPPATTDFVTGLPAAQGATLQIVVIAWDIHAGSAPSTFQFNTKPAGVGTAISPVIPQIASAQKTRESRHGLCVTNANEGLSITTGAGTGNTVGTVHYIVVG